MRLPIFFNILDIIPGTWNWSGYIYGIIWNILCYYLFKNFFTENNFFTIKIDKINIKYIIILSLVTILFQCILSFLFYYSSEYNFEVLLFQLTVPGISEGMLYRGILLGIMINCLKDNKFTNKNHMGVILIAVIFGCVHALWLTQEFKIDFNIIVFIVTGIMGYLFGLITIKSRSILPSIIVHNLSNFFIELISILK